MISLFVSLYFTLLLRISIVIWSYFGLIISKGSECKHSELVSTDTHAMNVVQTDFTIFYTHHVVFKIYINFKI